MKKVAVVLSGCGNMDGAEVTESVSTFIALSQLNAQYEVFAPDIEFDALDFRTRTPIGKRSVLIESARLARGKIKDLSALKVNDFDALVFPGGFGVATNLCSFSRDGAKAHVQPQVRRVIEEFHACEKPIAAICIAPVLLGLVLGKKGVTLTLGRIGQEAEEIKKLGAQVEECGVSDFVSDREHRVVSTPAYMISSAKPHEIYLGVSRSLKELVEMA